MGALASAPASARARDSPTERNRDESQPNESKSVRVPRASLDAARAGATRLRARTSQRVIRRARALVSEARASVVARALPRAAHSAHSRARARRVVRTFGDTHTRMRIQCATTSNSVGGIFSPLARAHMGLKASPMRRSDAIGRAIARRPRRRARASPRTLSRTHSPCSPKSSPSPPRPSPRPSTPSPSAVTPSFAVTPRVAKKARCVHDDDDDATRDDDDYRDDDADDDAKRARLTTVDRSESHSARTTTMRSV